MRGPHHGVYYRLYVVLDLFSRYIVGWLLASMARTCRRSASCAAAPEAELLKMRGLGRKQLVEVKQLLAEFGLWPGMRDAADD